MDRLDPSNGVYTMVLNDGRVGPDPDLNAESQTLSALI
jgi:hypothetical protein